ncbi:MAG: beta-phosphoglucomutase family hydrolase [Candidatus Omnitrophica bacterium]|nr:beta-phosphoglucomutase family hydrolase [Candidatus Omnitrophota bacterium]
MQFKGVIFDLDGVVVNTVPIHFKAWKEMFSEYGIDFTFNDYKAKVDGIPRHDGARAILSDLNETELKEAAAKKQKYFLEFIGKGDVPVYSSSVDLIKELKSHDKKVAVASSSRNCKRILEKVGIIHLADAIVDGHDITRGKPDPQIFQLAAERLGLACAECIVFEDAVLGVEAAVNGKMVSIGVDRYNNPARLAKANLVVDDLSKVDYKTIEGLFKQ